MLLEVSNQHPTPFLDLVQAPADYGGYCNASCSGAGGVWFGFEHQLPPIVWCIAFPEEIQKQLVSFNNHIEAIPIQI